MRQRVRKNRPGFLVTILINIVTVTAFAVRLSEQQEQHSSPSLAR